MTAAVSRSAVDEKLGFDQWMRDNRLPPHMGVVQLRIGDIRFELVSDYQDLLEDVEALLGDCALLESSDASFVRCVARHIPDSECLSLSFEGAQTPDPIDLALSLFRPLRHRQCYVEAPGCDDGWRRLVNDNAEGRVLLASRGRSALVNLAESPPEFLVECLVAVVQAAQPGVLFLHAASVGVAGSGALLIGAGHAGKSTTSLALASLGHSFLADDASAVRLATREVLPYPKSAGVRDEALAESLGWPLRRGRYRVETAGTGSRLVVRVGDLFPGSVGGPLPLRAAFVLDGFADRTTTGAFVPSLAERGRLRWLTGDVTASWGCSSGRQFMKVLTAIDVLSNLRCYVVQMGPPLETAHAIEELMEDI
jgi:hypothetical protein